MTESKIYADKYQCSFTNSDQFLDFLRERKENSLWMTAPSNSLQFRPLVKDTELGNLYMQLYQSNGRAEILADTMENTSLLLNVNGQDYPVRSCALKTILERARISGNALGKVSKSVLTQILNYCLDVATGDSLIKVADEKVSAVHGGDPSDYAVLEMEEMFRSVKDFLDSEFPGNTFLTANYDHSIVSAIWSLDGQASDLLDTYYRELTAHGLYGKVKVIPGLRCTTSDVGISGANLYPILINQRGGKIIPLGTPIKTEHSNGVDLDTFGDQLNLIYARFRETLDRQIKLMDIEISYPKNTMLGVLKHIRAPKKASYEALDQFLALNGEKSCTAYELYLAMSEVIFLVQCKGAGGFQIAQTEETIAKAVHVRWSDYGRYARHLRAAPESEARCEAAVCRRSGSVAFCWGR